MSDRTSAALFGEFFKVLAGDEPIDRAALAKRIWEQSRGYDFSPYQMNADDALIKLGLARKCGDCGYPIYDGEEHDKRDCDDNRC